MQPYNITKLLREETFQMNKHEDKFGASNRNDRKCGICQYIYKGKSLRRKEWSDFGKCRYELQKQKFGLLHKTFELQGIIYIVERENEY